MDCRLSSPKGELTEEQVRATAEECAALLGEDFMCYGDDSMAKVCVDLLRAQDKNLAVAETFSGGRLANAFTDICGASKCFSGGVVCYSNDAKMTLLDCPECLISQHGAVSAECAVALATGVSETLAADYGMSIAGFTGPCSGSKANPIGAIYVALHAPHGVWSKKFNYWLRRELVRVQSGRSGPSRRITTAL